MWSNNGIIRRANISLLNYANLMLRLVPLSAVSFENGAVPSVLYGGMGWAVVPMGGEHARTTGPSL